MATKTSPAPKAPDLDLDALDFSTVDTVETLPVIKATPSANELPFRRIMYPALAKVAQDGKIGTRFIPLAFFTEKREAKVEAGKESDYLKGKLRDQFKKFQDDDPTLGKGLVLHSVYRPGDTEEFPHKGLTVFVQKAK